jgi:hypothetical protein
VRAPVPTEKEDGCRGVRESGKQPETFVIQGSNETAGYPQAGIPMGIGKIGHSQAGFCRKNSLIATSSSARVRIPSTPLHCISDSRTHVWHKFWH